ncbi:MAG: hypothetical protein WBQ21_02685 [Solirubrobacteraceae bacterium]
MHTQLGSLATHPGDGLSIRRLLAPLLVSLALLFGVLGSSVATAAPAVSPSTSTATPPVIEVPVSELEPILGSVPVRDLGLSDTQLGELIAELNPALKTSAVALGEAVSTLLENNSSATLEQLVSSLSSQGGALGTLIHTLLPGLDPGEVVSSLNPTQLSELVDNLTGGKPGGALTDEELSQLLNGLSGKLSGEQQQLLTRILEELQGGASLSPTTVGSLAEQVGVAPEALAKEVGASAETLPAGAPALEATLGNEGPVVGVLKDAKGLAVALLPSAAEANGGGGSGANGTGGANGGNGTNGGAGTNGSAGAPGATSTVILPASASSAGATPLATKKLAKVKILSHKVRNGLATIVVQVPAAGKLTLSGKGVKTSVRKVAGLKRVTFQVRLTKARAASLRKHPRRLRVKLVAAFKATAGQGSSATATVTFG